MPAPNAPQPQSCQRREERDPSSVSACHQLRDDETNHLPSLVADRWSLMADPPYIPSSAKPRGSNGSSSAVSTAESPIARPAIAPSR